jgi:RNA polymerase sigma-70 factor (ECF subfamily)
MVSERVTYYSDDESDRATLLHLEALVARAQRGDREAFGEIFRVRADKVHRYIGAILRDDGRTEDATAETFIAAWKGLPKLREPDRFDAWLLRIAHHRAMDELRKLRPTVALDDAPEVADDRREASPLAVLEGLADSAVVQEALAELPDLQREVLTLRYLHELSFEEIATQLDRSSSAVRQLRQRGLAALRRQFEAAPGA